MVQYLRFSNNEANLAQLTLPESPLTDHTSCKRNTACGKPATIKCYNLQQQLNIIRLKKVHVRLTGFLTSSLISFFSASYTAPPQRTQPWNFKIEHLFQAMWNCSYLNKIFRWGVRLKRPPLSPLMRFLLIIIFPATRL